MAMCPWRIMPNHPYFVSVSRREVGFLTVCTHSLLTLAHVSSLASGVEVELGAEQCGPVQLFIRLTDQPRCRTLLVLYDALSCGECDLVLT